MKKKTVLNAYLRGGIYAVLHFAVEVACFSWLGAAGFDAALSVTVALLYDALAFLPQIGLGMLTDRFPGLPLDRTGLLLLAASWLLPKGGAGWIFGLLLLCAGNCAVHIAGAQWTLRDAGGRMGPSGIFVGGGSFGVITGQLLAAHGGRWTLPVVLLLLGLSLLLTLPLRRLGVGKRGQAEPFPTAAGFRAAAPRSDAFLLLAALGTVMLRAYVGYAIPTGWNKTEWQTVLLFSGMGIGKALGGVLADRFGARRIAVGSLLLSLPFLLLGNQQMELSLLGVALYSMTMAITLGVLVSVFPERPGYAFGITTVGLFLGTLPAFFFHPDGGWLQAMLLIGLTVAAALLAFVSSANENQKCKNKSKSNLQEDAL